MLNVAWKIKIGGKGSRIITFEASRQVRIPFFIKISQMVLWLFLVVDYLV